MERLRCPSCGDALSKLGRCTNAECSRVDTMVEDVATSKITDKLPDLSVGDKSTTSSHHFERSWWQTLLLEANEIKAVIENDPKQSSLWSKLINIYEREFKLRLGPGTSSAAFTMKESWLTQFYSTEGPLQGLNLWDTSILPNCGQAIQNLLESPTGDLNRVYLTWAIMDLSLYGYDYLQFESENPLAPEPDFANLLKAAFRKYPQSLEFAIALAFADLAVGRYFNGTESLTQILKDERISRSCKDVLHKACHAWVTKASDKASRGIFLPSSGHEPHHLDVRFVVRHPLVPNERFEQDMRTSLALMELRTNGQLPRVKLNTIESQVAAHWSHLGMRVLERFITVFSALTAPLFEHGRYSLPEPPVLELGYPGVLYLAGTLGLAECRCIVSCLQWLVSIMEDSYPLKALTTIICEDRYPHFRWGAPNPFLQGSYVASKSAGVFELDDSSKTCWSRLFQSGPIGVHVADHSFSHFIDLTDLTSAPGLQVPFDVLVKLACVENVTEIDGTPILFGFRQALVPVELFPESKSVQWHLVVATDDDDDPDGERFRWFGHSQQLRDRLPEKRVRNMALDDLKGMAYVGYCTATVKVTLGEMDVSKGICRSGLEQLVGTILIPSGKSNSATATVGGGGWPASLAFTTSRDSSRASLTPAFTPSDEYCYMVDRLYKRHILVYTQKTQTAMVCKLIHVILYVARAYVLCNHYDKIDQDIFKFTEGIDNMQNHIREQGSSPIQGDFSFAKLLTKLTLHFSSLYSEIREADAGILGFEVADIIENADTFFPRKLPVSTGIKAWEPIKGVLDVIFAWDLGSMIEMTMTSESKPQCAVALPSGGDVLLIPIPTLKELYARTLNRKDIRWKFTPTLFDCGSRGDCKGKACGVNRFQRIKTGTGKLRANGWIFRETRMPDWLQGSGVVCFGCKD